MQKAGLIRITFLVLTVYLGLGKSLYAQSTVDSMGLKLNPLEITDSTNSTLNRIVNQQPETPIKAVLAVPNVFTPNGDGVFDFFEVTTTGTSMLVFKVFTRTGALVYQTKTSFIRWDGKNENGKELPEGIYYYIIEDIYKNYENAKGFLYIFRGK